MITNKFLEHRLMSPIIIHFPLVFPVQILFDNSVFELNECNIKKQNGETCQAKQPQWNKGTIDNVRVAALPRK